MSAQQKISQKIDLGFVSLYLVKPNIVCVECLIEDIIDVEKGIQILEAFKTLVNTEMPHGSIVNTSNLYTPSKEFFKFIVSQRSPTKDNVVARALVTTNPASRIESQNFISFFKPLTPTKLFSKMEDATAWVELQLKEQA